MATTIVQAIPGVSNITLSAKSDLVQPYKYQWYRNNKMMGGSQWIVYSILNVSADDMKAKWSVEVTGENGVERSPDFTLSTAPPPPQIKPVEPTATPAGHPGPLLPPKPSGDLKAMGFTDAQIASMKGK